MSGDRIVANTSALIHILEGEPTAISLLDGMEVFISFMSELELLSSKKAGAQQLVRVSNLISDCTIIDLNQHIKDVTVSIRKAHSLKLPDCIIAATAIHLNVPLVTSDKGFDKLKEQLILYRF